MVIITSIEEMQRYSAEVRSMQERIGLVPTMGFLHEGHLRLIECAAETNACVVTSIFVNPTQFAPTEDFEKYPRDLERDRKLASQAGTSVLFIPDTKAMYPENFSTYLEVDGLSKVLEGAFRPIHFKGVTTVVGKLFNIVQPHEAFFGQKDVQQSVVIQKMVKDLNFPINIVIVPTVREPDGLAMSSRNVYLSDEERKDAVILSQSLQAGEKLIAQGETNAMSVIDNVKALIASKPNTVIDYVALVDPFSLQPIKELHSGNEVLLTLAVRFGKTRLIDNCRIHVA